MTVTILSNVSRRLLESLTAVYYGGYPASLMDADGNLMLRGDPVALPVFTANPTATPPDAQIGDNIALTLGSAPQAVSLSGVLLQEGIDRTHEIVDGIWTPMTAGSYTWSVTATNPGGSVSAPVVPGRIAALDAGPDYARALLRISPRTTFTGAEGAITGLANDGNGDWSLTTTGSGAEPQMQAEGIAMTAGGRFLTSPASLTPETTGGFFAVLRVTVDQDSTSPAIFLEATPATALAMRLFGGNIQLGFNRGAAARWETFEPVPFGTEIVLGIEVDDVAKTVRMKTLAGALTVFADQTFEDRTFTTLRIGSANFGGVIHEAVVVTRAEDEDWPITFEEVIADFQRG